MGLRGSQVRILSSRCLSRCAERTCQPTEFVIQWAGAVAGAGLPPIVPPPGHEAHRVVAPTTHCRRPAARSETARPPRVAFPHMFHVGALSRRAQCRNNRCLRDRVSQALRRRRPHRGRGVRRSPCMMPSRGPVRPHVGRSRRRCHHFPRARLRRMETVPRQPDPRRGCCDEGYVLGDPSVCRA